MLSLCYMTVIFLRVFVFQTVASCMFCELQHPQRRNLKKIHLPILIKVFSLKML